MYHCISRVVDRRFVLKDEERERFRMLMRMQENFSGCRVMAYCVMSNHFHVLLEVPPMPEGGLTDDELLKRLGALYCKRSTEHLLHFCQSYQSYGIYTTRLSMV